jgi:S-adenosylmethionine hydrolase
MTVHAIVVDSGVGSQRRSVAFETEEYYFVAPDNDVLICALAQEEGIKSVELIN